MERGIGVGAPRNPGSTVPVMGPFMQHAPQMGPSTAGNMDPNRVGHEQARASGVPVTPTSSSSLRSQPQAQQGWAPNGGGCQNQSGCAGGAPNQNQPSTQDVVTLLQQVIPRLSPQQAQAVQWALAEQLTHQSRGVPDRFGELPQAPLHQRFVQDASGTLPNATGCYGPQGVGWHADKDVFTKAEKWLGPPPQPEVEKWTSREAEVTGFADYLVQLQSWASMGSTVFCSEIDMASRWPEPIWQVNLSADQKVRSSRLLAILRGAFQTHGRTELMVRSFMEGLSLDGSVDPVRARGNTQCGFELLRQLTQQYSLRSRAEALSMRSELINRIFALRASDTSVATQVGDVIRKIDLELAKFAKLLGTLPEAFDRSGLSIGDGDAMVILLRSLPENAKQYVLHHSVGDTALKFERQQRLFLDLNLGGKPQKGVAAVTTGSPGLQTFAMDRWDDEGSWDSAWYDSQEWSDVNATTREKCNRCGKAHATDKCTTNLEKVKCFSCHEMGHIGANCPHKGKGKGKESQGKDAKGKGGKGKPGKSGGSNEKGKGKGKAGKQGKKGKMNEVSYDGDDGQWWSQEWDYNWQEPCLDQQLGQSALAESGGTQASQSAPLQMSSLLLCELMSEEMHAMQKCGIGELVWQSSSKDELGSHMCDVGKLASTGACVGTEEESERGLECAAQSLCFPKPVCVAMTSHPLCGLLTEVACDDHSWWLLDSGASVTVLSRASVSEYHAKVVGPAPSGFKAANGSAVPMTHVAEVCVDVRLGGDKKKPQWFTAKLTVLVGNTRHNILGTTALCNCGWTFSQSSGRFSLKHDATGMFALDTAAYAGCPWVQLRPRVDQSAEPLDMGDLAEPEAQLEKMEVDTLSPVKRVQAFSEEDLVAHRLQGHVPFHPACVDCQKARGVHHHRKRTDKGLHTELQADFLFISNEGQVSSERSPGSVKCLALKEVFSACVGCVVIDGVELSSARGCLIRWLHEFGLSSSTVSITMVTDSEAAVSSFVSRASDHFHFLVKKAGPQVHEAVGHAERCVRTLKEALQVLRSDMNRSNLDLKLGASSLQDVVTHVCMAQNRFGKAHGANQAPQEIATGRPLPETPFSLFLSLVLAETPDSMHEKYPNSPRFVEACFIHPQWASQGSLVIGKFRKGDVLVNERFVAKSIRIVMPPKWDKSFCPEHMKTLTAAEAAGIPADVAVPLSVGQGPSLNAPVSGPPSDWIRAHGFTEGCSACKGLQEQGSRKGKVHNRQCARRYEAFLRMNAQTAHAETPSASSPNQPEIPRLVEGHNVAAPGPVAPQVGSPVLPNPVGPSLEPRLELRTAEPLRRVVGKTPPQTPRSFGRERDGRHDQMQPTVSPVPVANTPSDSSSPVEGRLPAEKRKTLEQPSNVPPAEDMQVETEVERESVFRQKRRPEVETERLEREIEESRADRMVETVMELDLCWSADASPVCEILHEPSGLKSAPATAPEFFDPSIESIKFEHGEHEHVKRTLGGRTVLVWKPTSAVDDTTLQLLDRDLTFKGMCAEVEHLEQCSAGRLVDEAEAKALKDRFPHARVIQSRWVTAFKSQSRVRARIVAKDLNKGASARKLGFSSPTPSAEALNLLLAVAGSRDLRCLSLDVEHAFMHSPLPESEVVILKLPLSVSLETGLPAYLVLAVAVNGLRDASLRWLNKLASAIKPTGLWACECEPCLYAGSVVRPGDPKQRVVGKAILLVYVDDVILVCDTTEAEEVIVAAIESRVPLKVTGRILPSAQGGGEIGFIGRRIRRWPLRSQLEVFVPADYLTSCFEAYGIKSGSSSAPDLAIHLERANNKEHPASQPLSEEAYARFRKTLGKLLWWSQTRQDCKMYLSLLATQQSSPRQGTEAALRAFLRFLYEDAHVVLQMPSDEDLSNGESRLQAIIQSFSDASHAPYRFNNRRGVTGGVLSHANSLIKCLSRQQQSVSLSSCESELYAIQAVAQESVSFSKLVSRVYFAWHEVNELDPVVVLLDSDSAAALELLKGVDIPRKSRHIEVRLEWLRQKVTCGELVLRFRPGDNNVSDLMTKCLNTRKFVKHRTSLGFVVPSGPMDALIRVALRKSGRFA